MEITYGTLDNRTNGFRWNRLFIILAIVIVFALAVQLNLHSVLQRASDTEAIDQACSNHSLGVWEHATNGRFYQICQMPDGSFGIRVLIRELDGTFKKVTSFIRKTHGKPVMEFEKVLEYAIH
jgi:hypothetical protein